jgi:acetyl-CoA C-acetyltransferase
MAEDPPVYVAGAYEHPTREAPDKSTMEIHGDVARGALDDAGLSSDEVDGFCTANVPENTYSFNTPMIMADYLGLEDVVFADATDDGGSAQLTHVAHAVDAIRAGRCDVVLVTLGGKPRTRTQDTGTGGMDPRTYQDSFERIYGSTVVSRYAMAAKRHMHEYGTTPEQLAEIRVAASRHAQHNENALYRDPVTVEDVLESRPIADPLHLLDCCVITDGGGALVVVSEDVRDEIDRECVEICGTGEGISHTRSGRVDLTRTSAVESGERAFGRAGIEPTDVDYASIYDSFTITVLRSLEDLGFCERGEGGSFVEGGALEAPDGELPVNTDGGGLCSNHAANRGSITKVIEAVRQLRGEAAKPVQVEDPEYAIAHGTGGDLATVVKSTTLVLGGDRR